VVGVLEQREVCVSVKLYAFGYLATGVSLTNRAAQKNNNEGQLSKKTRFFGGRAKS